MRSGQIGVLGRLAQYASTWARVGAGALALSGGASCVGDRYAGVDLRVGTAPVEVQALARAARNGEKRAQFALGERYEHGNGVPIDPGRAAALYRAAAANDGGTRMMFVPQKSGTVSSVPVNTGNSVSGLPEARAKLGSAGPAQVRPSANDLRLKRALTNLEGVCSFASPAWINFHRKRVTIVTGRSGISDAVLFGWLETIGTNYAGASYLILNLEGNNSPATEMGEGLVQRATASGRLSDTKVDCFSLGAFRGVIILDDVSINGSRNFSEIQGGL